MRCSEPDHRALVAIHASREPGPSRPARDIFGFVLEIIANVV